MATVQETRDIETGDGSKHESHLLKRLVALVASLFIGLASGTPYLYGVYSPQFVRRIGLTASDSATISLAINLGSGVGGLFGGVMIDHKGPRFSILLTSCFIFVGYMGLYEIYEHAYANKFVICLCSVIMGFGSVTAYFSTLKAAQANFPHNRGTAGVFPVSAYGLAATLFSIITAKFFADNTGGLLKFLSIFCGSVAFIGGWFVGIYVKHQDEDDEEASQPLIALDSSDQHSLAGSFSFWGIGKRTPRNSDASSISDITPVLQGLREQDQLLGNPKRPVFESRNNSFSQGSSATPSKKASKDSLVVKPKKAKNPLTVIKKLLTDKLFLLHYLSVALIGGVGQTYIFSVGFIVTAQVNYINDPKLVVSQVQALQVAIISIGSFGGRLFSGIFSDIIYKKFHIQRLWIVSVVIVLMAIGMFLTMTNNGNVHVISWSSAILGVSYGLTFGAYPAVMADFFGTKSFSTIWGLICTGPLVVLYVLNKYFGFIYDKNTDSDTGICYKGNGCYEGAIEICFYICFFMLIINFVLIYVHRK